MARAAHPAETFAAMSAVAGAVVVRVVTHALAP